jgi:hypothetical protein
MILNKQEINKEIYSLSKNLKSKKNKEIFMCFITFLILWANFIFTIVAYVFNENINIWYVVLIAVIDIIVIVFSMYWYHSINKSSKGFILIPYSLDGINICTKLVTICNVTIGIFTNIFSLIYNKSEHKFFYFVFSLQLLFVFLLWNVLMEIAKKKINERYIKAIKNYTIYEYQEINKYGIYINSHYHDWARAYNVNLAERNKHDNTFKVRMKLIFTKFDFTGNKWKRQLIDLNQPISSISLRKVFDDEKVTTYDEFCKYRFYLFCQIFSTIYETDINSKEKFKLYYWIRESSAIKEFENRVKKYR